MSRNGGKGEEDLKPDATPSNKNIDLSHLSIYFFCIDDAVECFVYTTPSNGVNLIFKFSVIRHPLRNLTQEEKEGWHLF